MGDHGWAARNALTATLGRLCYAGTGHGWWWRRERNVPVAKHGGDPKQGHRLEGDELDGFLRRALVSHLACYDADGWPYVVPLWHSWDGDEFWVIAGQEAVWPRFLVADPRVALPIDETASLRRVLCRGTARLVEQPTARGQWNTIALEMAERYLGSDAVADYQRRTAG